MQKQNKVDIDGKAIKKKKKKYYTRSLIFVNAIKDL